MAEEWKDRGLDGRKDGGMDRWMEGYMMSICTHTHRERERENHFYLWIAPTSLSSDNYVST
jgi:hypothetical protein